MEWLNDNSGAITTIVTFALTIITTIYVVFTWKILKHTNRPEILVNIDWDKLKEGGLTENNFIAYICVINMGRGTAYDIEFDYDCTYELPVLQQGVPNRTLNEIKFLKDGVGVLGPGEKESEIAFGGNTTKLLILEQYWKEKQRRAEITVKYKGLEKMKYKSTFTLKFDKPIFSDYSLP